MCGTIIDLYPKTLYMQILKLHRAIPMTWVARLLPRLPRLTFGDTVVAVNIIFIGHFLTTHVGSFALTAGPSMLPTINAQGVWVYIDKTFRRGRGIQLGDVVDFQHPMVQGVGVMKRVMGMPGDFVVKDGGEGSGKMMIQVRGLRMEDGDLSALDVQEVAD